MICKHVSVGERKVVLKPPHIFTAFSRDEKYAMGDSLMLG